MKKILLLCNVLSAYIRKFCMCTEPRGVKTACDYTVYELIRRQFCLVEEKFYDCFINHSVLLKTTGFVSSLQLILCKGCIKLQKL